MLMDINVYFSERERERENKEANYVKFTTYTSLIIHNSFSTYGYLILIIGW